jgi:hypothetical protein
MNRVWSLRSAGHAEIADRVGERAAAKARPFRGVRRSGRNGGGVSRPSRSSASWP